ncbi:FecR family protein [Pseudomonas mangiferae]|uniref:FecR family protein n=1 Tax=Pseudomonas mangiferae TaxID=2593654 RepID=A0A553GW28_9PSED|nr:FecR family protein [Pseudomonas mangiferae]TRX73699.1 FecR family protein [Pseudomonas mangiferae]
MSAPPLPTDSLAEEALAWLVRLQDEAASAADRAAFAAWLETSADHRAAWQRAQRLWRRLDDLAPHLAPPPSAQPVRRTRRRRSLLAAAACLLLALGVGSMLRTGVLADYRSGVGEHRHLTLADGSRIELGSDSALSVDFSADRRRIHLYRGEAYFEVSPDPARPFVVDAGPLRGRALGTAFAVRRDGDQASLTVTEHQVAVEAGAAHDTLGRGQQVRYDDAGLHPAEPVDLRRALAWRRDRLVFVEAPLVDVLAELQRYRHGRILVTDPALARQPVTAVFRTDDPDAALRTIARVLPVRLTRATDWLVLVRPAS